MFFVSFVARCLSALYFCFLFHLPAAPFNLISKGGCESSESSSRVRWRLALALYACYQSGAKVHPGTRAGFRQSCLRKDGCETHACPGNNIFLNAVVYRLLSPSRLRPSERAARAHT